MARKELVPRVVIAPAEGGDPNALRREIRDARLKVTLDRDRGLETSPAVKRLAAMELPPLVVTSQGGASSRKPRPGQTGTGYRA